MDRQYREELFKVFLVKDANDVVILLNFEEMLDNRLQLFSIELLTNEVLNYFLLFYGLVDYLARVENGRDSRYDVGVKGHPDQND